MLVYLAYGLLIAHVALGALQSETSPALVAMVGAGVAIVGSVHLIAASKERRIDAAPSNNRDYADCGPIESLKEGFGKTVSLGSERVAVFKHEGAIYALSNVCRHQGGPLGEGRIIDGCVTCPWHGYQYRPDTGISPPPYSDRVETFPVLVTRGRISVRTCHK
jgi:nitrite reductase/ring-hydroxylating ferredoxin subunit